MDNKLSIKEALAIGSYFSIKKSIRLLELTVGLLLIQMPLFLITLDQSRVVLTIEKYAFLRMLTLYLSCIYTTLVLLPVLFGLYRTGIAKSSIAISFRFILNVITLSLLEAIFFSPFLPVFSNWSEVNQSTVVAGLVLAALICFVIFLYPYLYFASCVLIDKNTSLIDSLKISYRISNKHKLFLFGYIFLMSVLLTLSIKTFVGYLIVVPIVLLSRIHLYHALQGREGEMAKLN